MASSASSWQFWRPSGKATNPSVPLASTSAVTLEDTIAHEEYAQSSTAVADPPLASPSGSGNAATTTIRSPLETPSNTIHLHSLTERKLEKAVLGRAVGLRQLVLLSNAFSSRAKSYATGAYGSDNSSYENDGDGYTDDEMDPSIVDLEDEMDRKKREEDWLDSVLDEMLTDEMEQESEQQEEDKAIEPDYFAKRSHREEQGLGLLEPYVHLSIKDRRHAKNSSSTPPLLSLYSTFPPSQHPFPKEVLHPMLLSEVQDSGFLEPALIPLPLSTETTPDSSAASQDDDEDDLLPDMLEEDEMFDMDDLPPLPDSDSDDGFSEPAFELATNEADQMHIHQPLAIDIPALSSTSSRSPYSHDFSMSALTPELAYSANSINSFLTNLSSSPPTSLLLLTPGSSPTEPSVYVKQQPVLDEIRIRSIEEDAADTDGEDRLPDTPDTREGKHREEGAVKHPEHRVHLSPSMELVRYQPVIGKISLDETLRIPRSGTLGEISPSTIPLYSATTRGNAALPKLPSSLLSTILGRNPPHIMASVRSTTSSQQYADTFNEKKKNKASTSIPHLLPRTPTVQLPIFLPYEVVKSLYDSVDFGIPPRSTSPVTTPFVHSATLPAFASTSSWRTSTSAEPGVNSVRSAPTSPRKRSKSLSLLDVGNVSYDSSGSLLFSSLGIYDRIPAYGTDYHAGSEGSANHEGGNTFQPKFTAASFGRGIVKDWSDSLRDGRRATVGRGEQGEAESGRRDSRSPSRLRVYHQADEMLLDDFDFGSA